MDSFNSTPVKTGTLRISAALQQTISASSLPSRAKRFAPRGRSTSLLLLAVLDDAGRVHEGDALQQLVGHLHPDQLLQEVLPELLQRGEGAGAVGGHHDALHGADLLPVHDDGELRGSGLSTCTR